MARDRGPRLKKCRAVGCELPGLTRKSTERKPYPPGHHGPANQRRKVSTYGKQLMEKQKLRFNYGVTESYLSSAMNRAFQSRKNPGEELIRILESRLDCIVFRCGMAPTIPAARQLVRHGHVKVNGRRVDIPSFSVKVGNELEVTEKGQKIPSVKDNWEAPTHRRPTWVACENDKFQAKVTEVPNREEIGFPLELSSVVEYYSR